MIFTAKIQTRISDDAVEDLREQGYKDTAIEHMICDEIKGEVAPFYLTEFGELEFTDCEIKTDKEKVELPF